MAEANVLYVDTLRYIRNSMNNMYSILMDYVFVNLQVYCFIYVQFISKVIYSSCYCTCFRILRSSDDFLPIRKTQNNLCQSGNETVFSFILFFLRLKKFSRLLLPGKKHFSISFCVLVSVLVKASKAICYS